MTPEQRALVQALAAEAIADLEAAGAIERAPTLLDFTWRDMDRLTRQGAVLRWVMNQLEARWSPFPDRTLADLLKTERPDRVALFAAQLAAVGITDLQPDESPEDDDG